MSDIYAFEIQEIKDRTVTIFAQIVHPDVDWVEDTKNFALQVLMEPFYHIKKGYVYNSAWQSFPFTQEEGNGFLESHPLKEQLDYWLELMHGREVESSEEEYKMLTSGNYDKENPRYQNMGSYGGGSAGWTISYGPEYKAFLRVAELAIAEVEMKNEKHMPWKHNSMSWEEREKITDEQWDKMYENKPECELIITVLNDKLLHHLREGTSWRSAMYDFTYYAK